ncbi:uncharacterized protein LOC121382269 isoform X2 [Gigantopelta aegis]|uniref:uncharacterized protein LOC121382269 isoform X2 n=1 Tax=Gigantopelta aegis TaxID=1735272 RepID=UPI001B88CC25|nr:uncharacterized protein LOC121382269 isoform X2 [Gigantopelta aegis]
MYRGATSSVKVTPERKNGTRSQNFLKHRFHVMCLLIHNMRNKLCTTTTNSPTKASLIVRKRTKAAEHTTGIPSTKTRSQPSQPGPTDVTTSNISHTGMTSPKSGIIVMSSDKSWQISQSRVWGKDTERYLVAEHGPLPDGVHLKSTFFCPIPSTRVGCAAHCLASHSCLAFTHSQTRQLCQLINRNRVFKEHLAFDVGWKMYHV